MDISFTFLFVFLFICLFVFFVFVYTVTDFSSDEKASGVKFCRKVHRRGRESSILGNFALPEAQNGTNRRSEWTQDRHVWITVKPFTGGTCFT